jgi:hypothetical protein
VSRTNFLRAASLAALTTLALASCAGAEPSTNATPASSTPHGFVEGAAEATEPQLHLATVSTSGEVVLLDLLTETSTAVGMVDDAAAVTTDGRYVFASSPTAGGVTVIDTGVWTVDHEDHFHYYRADPRVVGTVDGTGEAVVTGGTTVTAVWFSETGEGVLLDSAALGTGSIEEVARISGTPHTGALVPFGESVLATTADASGVPSRVEVLEADGKPADSAGATGAAGATGVAGATGADCADLAGTITTNVGVVFGCADGALLTTTTEQGIAFETIPYPSDVAGGERAFEFHNRAGRPSVAAVSGTRGAWILDTRERTWTLLATDVPLLQVSAADDTGDHVVALATDGRILVLDATSGALLSSTEPILASTLADPALASGVELTVDASRAYVNATADDLIYEIDYADGARVARTFPVDAPAYLVETGR